MANILISIAAKIAEYPVIPILRQFEYLTKFDKNVKNLKQQVQKLEILKLQINKEVERATRNGDIIEPQVQRWLASVDDIINQVRNIEDETKIYKNCFHGFCPNCIYRYRVSRKSTKKAKLITTLQKEGKFKRVSYPSPLPGVEYSLSKDISHFESRNSTMGEILDELGKDETGVVILHGMRGVGKTILAKQVCKSAKEQKLFDEIVMGVVSRNPDLKDVQGQLADMLGLKFVEESEVGRARRLYLRLKNEKKILIILDDVWGKIDLEAIGIPHHCKILITTGNENIEISGGDGVKKISLKGLLEEESWSLFKSVVGDIIETQSFSVIAKEIVGKCMGLPLVIVTIGKRLKDKKIEEWNYVSRKIEGLETKGANLDDLLKDYV